MNVGSVAEWRRFNSGQLGSLSNLVERLAKGELSNDAFGLLFVGALDDGHSGSWVRGKARALRDPLTSLDSLDYRRIRDIHDLEQDFLAGFLDDLDAGRYTKPDGSLDSGAIGRRAQMYGLRLRGTANEAFVETSPADDQFKWVLGVSEHCSTCLELASLSPFSKDELWTFPGAGDTECVTHCNCHLERVRDGLRGFRA